MKEEVKSSVSSIVTNSFTSKDLYISLEKKEPIEMRLRTTRLAASRSAEVRLYICINVHRFYL